MRVRLQSGSFSHLFNPFPRWMEVHAQNPIRKTPYIKSHVILTCWMFGYLFTFIIDYIDVQFYIKHVYLYKSRQKLFKCIYLKEACSPIIQAMTGWSTGSEEVPRLQTYYLKVLGCPQFQIQWLQLLKDLSSSGLDQVFRKITLHQSNKPPGPESSYLGILEHPVP